MSATLLVSTSNFNLESKLVANDDSAGRPIAHRIARLETTYTLMFYSQKSFDNKRIKGT